MSSVEMPLLYPTASPFESILNGLKLCRPASENAKVIKAESPK
jgi:hypothetical protein